MGNSLALPPPRPLPPTTSSASEEHLIPQAGLCSPLDSPLPVHTVNDLGSRSSSVRLSLSQGENAHFSSTCSPLLVNVFYVHPPRRPFSRHGTHRQCQEHTDKPILAWMRPAEVSGPSRHLLAARGQEGSFPCRTVTHCTH